MPISPAQTLRLANQRLKACLLAAQNPALVPTGFPGLLDELRRVSSTWQDHYPGEAELSSEVWSLRESLQELAALLPSLHTRLLLEKARLETARVQVAKAAAWAEVGRKTL